MSLQHVWAGAVEGTGWDHPGEGRGKGRGDGHQPSVPLTAGPPQCGVPRLMGFGQDAAGP